MTWMDCVGRGSASVTERQEVTAQSQQRFRCRDCCRQFNERCFGVLERPTDSLREQPPSRDRNDEPQIGSEGRECFAAIPPISSRRSKPALPGKAPESPARRGPEGD
jgi:hypothetical protein